MRRGKRANTSSSAVSYTHLNAALYPDERYVAEKYLYFCSKDPSTGELHFSRTLEEHERAVAIYAPLWKAYDLSLIHILRGQPVPLVQGAEPVGHADLNFAQRELEQHLLKQAQDVVNLSLIHI